MPYIKQERRKYLVTLQPECCGELNYVLTRECIEYLKTKGESYQTYNDIIGALEGCKLELYSRKISIYEKQKCYDNGDVYD